MSLLLSKQSEGVSMEVVMDSVWRAVVGGGSSWELGREDGGVEVEVEVNGAWCEEVEELAKLECAALHALFCTARPGLCGTHPSLLDPARTAGAEPTTNAAGQGPPCGLAVSGW